MTELQRRAQVRLPMSEAEVQVAYTTHYIPETVQVIGQLCESHERLRAELAGLQVRHDEMQAEVSAVLAEFDRVANAGAVGGSTFRACCARLRAVVGEGKANE